MKPRQPGRPRSGCPGHGLGAARAAWVLVWAVWVVLVDVCGCSEDGHVWGLGGMAPPLHPKPAAAHLGRPAPGAAGIARADLQGKALVTRLRVASCGLCRRRGALVMAKFHSNLKARMRHAWWLSVAQNSCNGQTYVHTGK